MTTNPACGHPLSSLQIIAGLIVGCRDCRDEILAKIKKDEAKRKLNDKPVGNAS